MSQIALYIDDVLEEKINAAAQREGKSRSAWVKEAILQKMGSGLSDSWFQLWGTWLDERSPQAIVAAIDAGYGKKKRMRLK